MINILEDKICTIMVSYTLVHTLPNIWYCRRMRTPNDHPWPVHGRSIPCITMAMSAHSACLQMVGLTTLRGDESKPPRDAGDTHTNRFQEPVLTKMM